jgi:hypothetical protein
MLHACVGMPVFHISNMPTQAWSMAPYRLKTGQENKKPAAQESGLLCRNTHVERGGTSTSVVSRSHIKLEPTLEPGVSALSNAALFTLPVIVNQDGCLSSYSPPKIIGTGKPWWRSRQLHNGQAGRLHHEIGLSEKLELFPLHFSNQSQTIPPGRCSSNLSVRGNNYNNRVGSHNNTAADNNIRSIAGCKQRGDSRNNIPDIHRNNIAARELLRRERLRRSDQMRQLKVARQRDVVAGVKPSGNGAALFLAFEQLRGDPQDGNALDFMT